MFTKYGEHKNYVNPLDKKHRNVSRKSIRL